MRKLLSVIVVAIFCATNLWAQSPIADHARMPGKPGAASSEEAIRNRQDAIAGLQECDVLAVFAHPDDETFASGTFAKLSDEGKRVLLVYATSGDAGGDVSGRNLSGALLAQEREREMRKAAEALMLPTEPLFLRFPDGEVYDYWNEVLDAVGSIIERTRPGVVITFGPDGYYGHADHVAVGQITARAFDDSGIPSFLLHIAISRSRNDMIRQFGGGSRFKPVADRFITYTVDVKDQLDKRIAAVSAHKTQFDARTMTQYRLLAALTGTEQFVEVRRPRQDRQFFDLLSPEGPAIEGGDEIPSMEAQPAEPSPD